MVRKSSSYLYTGISVPKNLVESINKFREKHPDKVFRSSTEFIIVAIREKLERE